MMRSKIGVIAFNEIRQFVYSPFAMVIVPAFLVLIGNNFYTQVFLYDQYINPTGEFKVIGGLSVVGIILVPFYQAIFTQLVLFVPLITMRTFAEEKKLGNFELWLSYPLRPVEIIVGKYLGNVILVLCLVSLSLLHTAIPVIYGDPYMPQIWSAYLGLFLYVCLYVAMGMLASLVTENQLIAAVVTYGFYLSTFIFRWLAFIVEEPLARVFTNFLFDAHVRSMTNGVVYSGDIAAALLTTAGFLIICHAFLSRSYKR